MGGNQGILDEMAYYFLLEFKMIVNGITKAFDWLPIIGGELDKVNSEFSRWVDGFAKNGQKQFASAGSLAGQAWGAAFSSAVAGVPGVSGPVGTPNTSGGPAGVTGPVGHPSFGLPASITYALKAAAAGHGSMTAANAQAYGFYQNILSQGGLTRQQRLQVFGLEAPYAPTSSGTAFGTPAPFGSTGTGWQLPLQYQVAITNAQQSGSVAAQISATKTAIAYINAVYTGLSPANKIAAESAKSSLVSSLQSLTGTGTGTGNVLPSSFQTAIDTAAYQAAIGGSTRPEVAAVRAALSYVRGHIGATPPQSAQRDAYAQEGTSLANQLASLLGTGASTSGVGFLPAGLQARLTAAQNATAGISGSTSPTSTTIRALNGLFQQLNAAVMSLTKQIKDNTFMGKQLQAAQSEQTTLVKQRAAAAQQLLNERNNLSVEHLLGIAGGSQTGRTAAASATSNLRTFLNDTLHRFGLTGTGSGTLGPFVQELRKNGDINQRQYMSLEKILTSINDIKKINGTVASGITGNISARLAEIKQELQTQTGFGNAYVKDTIDRGVSGKTFERQSASLSNRGLIPRGGAALGVPYGPGGVHIHVNGAQDPKAVAREVHNILVGQARRNTTQYTGASAGTNQGLG